MKLDEIPTLSREFHSMVSHAFTFKNHKELLIVPRDETHFFSLFFKYTIMS